MNVLVVEDEILLAIDLQELLEGFGFTCIGPAATVSEACKLIDSHPLDAALLDVRLKDDQLIWPAARKLLHFKVPFAFVSAQAKEMIEPEFSEVPFFPKPMNEARVRQWLRLNSASVLFASACERRD